MILRTLPFALALAAASSVAAAQVPADAAILPHSAAADLLNQCSRPSPPAGEAGWTPSAADIEALEAALPAALSAERGGREDWSRVPAGWRRQYVGLVRGGRRFVYGNFFPVEAARHDRDPVRWRREPVIVCDGGPSFFGVEYDVEARRFTHFGFNGSA